MGNSALSHEEYMDEPGKYEDFDLTMDEAGKYKVVAKEEARRRQDLQVLTKIYDKLGDSSTRLLISHCSR